MQETIIRNELKQRFERMRAEAVKQNEPTAFVLVEHRDDWRSGLDVESFSMRRFLIHGDVAIVHAHEHARTLGWRTWLIDVFGEQWVSDPNAFEMAWDARSYYHRRSQEVQFSGHAVGVADGSFWTHDIATPSRTARAGRGRRPIRHAH